MASEPLVSVVITNFDYAAYVGDAIESALGQRHPRTEVIVVDDGSSDDSRSVIEVYRDRVCPVFKANGGQGSAVNAGFAACSGDLVIFLDADDVLLPTAAGRAEACLTDDHVVKAHWPLTVIDGDGRETGALFPGGPLAEGDLRHLLLSSPDHGTPPQSGNAFARGFLEAILPMPEAEFRTGADTYLFLLALAYGELRAIDEPQSCYRRHGGNEFSGHSFDDRIARVLRWTETSYDALAEHCARLGVAADPAAWRRNSWVHRLARVRDDLRDLLPPGAPFILIDDDDWGMRPEPSHRPIPFLERNGEYWGPPPDDATAIAEVDRLRRAGAEFLVLGWPAFWWLEHYEGLRDYLTSEFRCLARNDRMLTFDLTGS